MPPLFISDYFTSELRGRGRGRPRPRKTMSLPLCPVRGASIVSAFQCHCRLCGIAGEDAHVPGLGARNKRKSKHVILDALPAENSCPFYVSLLISLFRAAFVLGCGDVGNDGVEVYLKVCVASLARIVAVRSIGGVQSVEALPFVGHTVAVGVGRGRA